jgi:hypothetical protein
MKTTIAWILWLLVAAAVYFFLFMAVIFGMAVSGGHGEVFWPLMLATAVGVGTPFCLSLYLMRKQRFVLGVASNLVAMPLVFGLFKFWL